MSAFSTPSRPNAGHKSSDSTSSSVSTASSGFTPGGAVPVGYSYLGRSPSLVTPTRKGEHGKAARNAGGDESRARVPRFPTSLSHSEFVRSEPAPATSTTTLSRSNTLPSVLLAEPPRPRPRPAKRAPPANHRTSAFYDPSSLSDLPLDPKTWLPSHVSLYLSHILHLVPAPVMETLHAFVASEHLSGRAFLRLREADLAAKGMNTRWRKLMSEASRRLRRDALRRRLWNQNDDAGANLWAEDENSNADAAPLLTPSQKRIMTATLKRIRDRKQVQGLIAALESPTSKDCADLPSVEEGPPGGGSPRSPFGSSGFVQRQTTSFEDLAAVARQDALASSSPRQRRQPRSAHGSDDSMGAASMGSPTLSTGSSASSLFADYVKTPHDELPAMDFGGNIAKAAQQAPSLGSLYSDSEEDIGVDDDDDDDGEAWKPLEQDLVDAILAVSTDSSAASATSYGEAEDECRPETPSESPAASYDDAIAETNLDTLRGKKISSFAQEQLVDDDTAPLEAEFKAPHIGTIFAQPSPQQQQQHVQALGLSSLDVDVAANASAAAGDVFNCEPMKRSNSHTASSDSPVASTAMKRSNSQKDSSGRSDRPAASAAAMTRTLSKGTSGRAAAMLRAGGAGIASSKGKSSTPGTTRGRRGGKELLAMFEEASRATEGGGSVGAQNDNAATSSNEEQVHLSIDVYAPRNKDGDASGDDAVALPPGHIHKQRSFLSISRHEADKILAEMQGLHSTTAAADGDEDVNLDLDLNLDFALEEGREGGEEELATSGEDKVGINGATTIADPLSSSSSCKPTLTSWLADFRSNVRGQLNSASMSYVVGLGAGIGFVVVSEVIMGARRR